MPATRLSANLSIIVESLCEQGCNQVNETIRLLELKQPVEALKHFNEQEKKEILFALSDIMSVYTDKNDS